MRFTLTPAYLDNLERTDPGFWSFKIQFNNGDDIAIPSGGSEKVDYAVFTVLVNAPHPLVYTPGTQSEIDYSVWYLQSPELYSPLAPYFQYVPGGSGRQNLMDREYTAWWYNNPLDRAWDVFRVPAVGMGTSGSAHVRCELREVTPDGRMAEWDPRGYNVMESVIKGELPSPPPPTGSREANINQVWGSGNQMEMGYNMGGNFVRVAGGSNTSGINGGTAYTVRNSVSASQGTTMRIRAEVINRALVYWIDVTNTAPKMADNPGAHYVRWADCTSALQYFYFKAGNYDQASLNKGIFPDLRDQQSIIHIKELDVYHNHVRGRLRYYNGEPVPEKTEVSYIVEGGGLLTPYTGIAMTDADGYYWVKNLPLQWEQDTCASAKIMPPLSIGGRSPDKAVLTAPPRGVPITEVYIVPDVVYY
jgi:hypothetical protein